MIIEIHKKLELWAVWAENGCGHRLGYKESTLSRLTGGGGASSHEVDDYVFDRRAIEDCELIEGLISGSAAYLGFECVSPSTLKVVMAYYRTPGTPSQKARDLKCCRNTLYRWLDRAHSDVGRCLDQAKSTIRTRGLLLRQRGVCGHFINMPEAQNENVC